MPPPSPYHHTLLLCLAEILALAAIATFPALLPTFREVWQLTNTEAGWISAAYFGGYMLSVPFLAGVTDRIDARKIMATGAAVGALTAGLFALLAQGFWSALVLRFLAGISLAGVYMPGLKVVSDHIEGRLQSRFVSFYTASFAIGSSLSYLLAGEIQQILNWRWAFAVSGASAAVSFVLIRAFVPAAQVRPGALDMAIFKDFRVVLKTSATRAYILGYAAHMWELFSLRAWIVAFLAFSLSLQAGEPDWSPTRLAFLVNLVGLPASIGGNEMARLFGRRRVVTTVMIVSAVLGCGLGFSAALPYAMVAALALAYGVSVVGDSAALTAGAVAAAPEGYRGATLAVHSTLGFGAAFAGPLVVGVVLDVLGGGRTAWAMGFACMAGGGLLGTAALARSGGRSEPDGSRGPGGRPGHSDGLP